MSGELISVLMATSIESATAVEEALISRFPKIVFRRIDNAHALDEALANPDWDLAFSDLELPDFSALDLASLLSEKGIDMPVVLIKGTGVDEIALRCLELGMGPFIQRDAQYLQILPRLVDTLLKNAEQAHAHRLIEKRLLESEERYLDVFDNTTDLIQCIAPDGRITYTNRAWRETLGYTEQEVKSLSLVDVLHPDSMICCQDRFRRLMNGESLARIDFKFVGKSGETVHLVGDCGSMIKEGGVISTRGIFRNITDTVRAEEALKITEARYQALYENAPDIYCTISASGEILSINQTGASMLGYEVHELIGESVAMVMHPEDQHAVFSSMENIFKEPEAKVDIEYRKIRKDGSIFWVHQRAILEPGDSAQRLLAVCRDITEKRHLEDRLAYQASHDGLTNLINRRELERRFQQLPERGSSPEDAHMLCFLDLDQFKLINDTCGHIAGDELLRQIAALLKSQVRARDTVARIGGDEFAVLMEHATLDNALQLAEKIRAGIDGFEFHWRARRFSIGVSIGVVPIRIGQSIADALNVADMACYAAKKDGRNRVHAIPADAGVSQ